MANVIVGHPDADFSGYLRVAGRGLLFTQGFTELVDLTAAQQTVLTSTGFTVDGEPETPVPDPFPQYLTEGKAATAIGGTGPLGVAGRAAFGALAANRSPLAALDKASTSPYRILQVGTSISFESASPNHLLVQQLKTLRGASSMFRHQAGYLDGSFLNSVNGWQKQPYSGVQYVRLRGSSTSTALTDRFAGYGDQVVIEWSRESDTAAAEVLVDGVSVGTFGTPGTQRFGMRTTFTVAKGAHTVTINPPASGHAYVEAVEFRDTARRGVETIDGTLGGSSLAFAATPANADGQQTAPIATTTGAGIRALFGRDDIDLIIASFLVNDAGYNPADPTGADYRQLLNAAAVSAKTQGTPIVFIAEPAGSYALPTPNGNAALHTRYEACKVHLQQVADLNDHVFLADWDTATRISDLAAYAAAYYPTVTGLNVGAGTYTGDFTHPDGTLTNSSQDIGKRVLAETLGLASAVPAQKLPLLVELGAYTASGVSLRPYSTGVDGAFPRRPGTLYRDAAVTNSTFWLNDEIAAAGTTDANGKYLAANGYNFYALGALADGTQRMLTLKIGPNASGIISVLGSDSGMRFYDPDGVEMTPTFSQKRVHLSSIPAGTVVTLAFPISQDTTNKYLTIDGRLYEGAVTDTSVPVLVTAP